MFRSKLAGLLVATAVLFWAGAASAAGPDKITGSAHDFQGQGWSGGQICVVCHTTHNGSIVQGAPLWNHELTTGTGGWTLYSGVAMAATPLDPGFGQAGEGISTLCLSCHDGTVALDSFGGVTGTTFISGTANVTTDLSDDHPIAIPYNIGLQGDMEDPATATTDIGGTIDNDLLFGGRVECASCHDVHNDGLGATALLTLNNAASNLCQTCHLK
jgi:hypothetical protein